MLFLARNVGIIVQYSYNVLGTSYSTAIPFLGFYRWVQAIIMTSQLKCCKMNPTAEFP